ncbi:MAG: M13 family metallopeptidase, partial [Luteibacter sp.]
MIRVPASLLLASMVLAAQAQQGPAIGRFGFDTTGMDLSVPPGDDIYAYANGTWANSTPIPPDKSSVGQFTRLADINTARLREILDAERNRPASLAGAAYASYLDAARVERLGMRPFKPVLDRIHAIRTRDDVMAASAEAWREGVAFPLSIVVDVDNGAPDRYVAVVSQAGLGMPDRSYYLDETAPMRKAREAYLAYLTDVLDFLGESDAARRAQDLLDFETAVARDSWTPQRTRDAKAAYNPMSTDALSRATPGFDVGALLRRLGDRTGKVVVTQPDAVAAIAKRVGDAPIQVLRDALLVGEFHAYAQFLPSRAYAIDFAFFGQTIDGSDEAESRSTRAVAFAVAAVPDEVSRPYVARYFTPETKASAEAMVKEIIAAMDRRIDRLDWMTPATRSRAHAKLAAFTAKIGYPDRWHDYRGLALKPDDLFGNALRARRWQQAWNIGKAGKPPYRWEWSSTPMTVDAFADFPMIAITFPAAILQPPFFDPHADMAVN